MRCDGLIEVEGREEVLFISVIRGEEGMAPRARFELATLRLTAEMVEILNALFGVAYRECRLIISPSVGLLGLPKASEKYPYASGTH